ncbi:WhiB family transcriptional regulator [Kocuria oceani]|uniref:WhiB family transcriptional regulator n=1 Tax=Kocuria oceani TaxID=988827 RepID=A0ABV9TIN1_9MICC|nr:WhiB family transcriptional regulator [Kocuria oceani]
MTARKPPEQALANQHGTARQVLEQALAAAELSGRPIPCRGAEAPAWTDPDTETLEVAALLCENCPALQECRSYAVQAGEDGGAYGGLTPAQIRRARRRAQEQKTRRADRAA